MSTPGPEQLRKPPAAPKTAAEPSVTPPHVLYLHLHDPAGRGRLLGAEPGRRAGE